MHSILSAVAIALISSIGAQDTPELRRRIDRMLQLHLDLSDFMRMTREHATHAWVEPAGFGRLLCGTTLWEDAVKIICTTNEIATMPRICFTLGQRRKTNRPVQNIRTSETASSSGISSTQEYFDAIASPSTTPNTIARHRVGRAIMRRP